MSSLHGPAGGINPAASPGNPTPVGDPKPKDPNVCCRRSLPTRSATIEIPTLLECAMMSPSVIRSSACGSASWIVYPSIVRVAGTRNVSVVRTVPDSRAAAAVIVLFTEPGSHVSVTARFTRSPSSTPENAFGSNVGYVAIA